jgi:hypothetical protein
MVFTSTATQAQFSSPTATPSAPVREVAAVFIGMADCCDALTKDLVAPIDSARKMLRLRALRAGEVFRMVGVSLDWDPKVGWNYISQFGEFDEVGLGSNWFGLQPEILMFSGSTGVQPSVPQLVLIERTITLDTGNPTFGPRRVLRALQGRDQIIAWVQSGAPLP